MKLKNTILFAFLFTIASASNYLAAKGALQLDTIGPVTASPVMDTFCGLEQNDQQLWIASYWYDPKTNRHDLHEGPAHLEITVEDTCSISTLSITYELFLDLDGNDTLETVVQPLASTGGSISWFNYLRFGNINNPNYLGGELRVFDFRPVIQQKKWGFYLELDPVNGMQRTARVSWRNIQGESTVPMLPLGRHKIRWILKDTCGNERQIEQAFLIRDCTPPTVTCKTGETLLITSASGGSTFMVIDHLLEEAQDNYLPDHLLTYALRWAGTGSGFPLQPDGTPQTDHGFGCLDFGPQYAELWVRDQAGNTNSCLTSIFVDDPSSFCCLIDITFVSGTIRTPIHQGVQDVQLELQTETNGLPVNTQKNTDLFGFYRFYNGIPPGGNAVLTPYLNTDPLNGVNTWDLVLISRHILNLVPFDSPYKLIAADANKSGTITTLDNVELRKLILGTHTELPNNTSWRFIDASQQFTDNNNPFLDSLQEQMVIYNTLQHVDTADFVGIKVGDVDFSATSNCFLSNEERTNTTFLLELRDTLLAEGQEYTVLVHPSGEADALQFTLQFVDLELVELRPGVHQTLEHFGVFSDAITAATEEPEPFSIRFRAQRPGKLSSFLSITDKITASMAFSQNERRKVLLRYKEETPTGLKLFQNIPNPWSESTTIGFEQPDAGEVVLTVYDGVGRVIHSQNAFFEKGYHTFHLTNTFPLTGGMGYYRLDTSSGTAVKTFLHWNKP